MFRKKVNESSLISDEHKTCVTLQSLSVIYYG